MQDGFKGYEPADREIPCPGPVSVSVRKSQAAILVAALGDLYPGAIEAAVGDIPRSARRYLQKALPLVIAQLGEHPRAAEELEAAVRA
ncbi:MAG: hypothetical protein PSX71_11790 [bacterium]|nr:hypothetical protein [bacterium]